MKTATEEVDKTRTSELDRAPEPTDQSTVRGPLPMVLGGTGHGDLRDADREALGVSVREILRELADRYPATPLVVMSSLAPGADCLIARAALDLGLSLIAPLAMAPVECEQTFLRGDGTRDESSIAEFRDLLGRADRWFVLDDPDDPLGSRGPEYPRAKVGVYICRNCGILIALWDGQPSDRPAGTAEVVRLCLEGIPPEFDPGQSWLDSPRTRPVIQVVTPRADGPEPKEAFRRIDHFPGGPEDQGLAHLTSERVYRLIDQFNRDARQVDGTEAIDASRRQLFPEYETSGLPSNLRAALHRFALADVLAIQFQRRTHTTLLRLLAFGFVASILFQLHLAVHTHARRSPEQIWQGPLRWLIQVDPLLVMLYLAAFLCVFFVYYRSRTQDHQRRFVDYRSLAEGLRVHFFWRLVGLPDVVADHYLRRQAGEMEWVGYALRVGDLLDGAAVPTAEDASVDHRFRLTLRHWVDEQILYYVGRARRDSRKHQQMRPLEVALKILSGSPPSGDVLGRAKARRHDRAGRFYGSLSRILLHVAVPAFALTRGFMPAHNPLVLAFGILVTLLALAGIYGKVMAFSEHATQYGRTGTLFSNARRRLSDLLAHEKVDRDEVWSLLTELGREALAESGDWLLLHRARPLELPRT